MKLTISFLLFFLSFNSFLLGSALEESLLREAAEKDGYLPAEKVNLPFDSTKSAIGKKLFESSTLSFNSDMNCQTCHLPQFSSGDGLSNAIGTDGAGHGLKRLMSGGQIVPRNTLPLWGRGGLGFKTFF